MEFTVQSQAFKPGDKIPPRFSGEGEDHSPSLEWTSPPSGTKELVLIVDDPDAPMAEPFVHWLVYKIPASARALPEGLPRVGETPRGLRQGRNSFSRLGYNGPLPPPGHGIHHYNFKLYAVDEPVLLPPGATKDELKAVIAPHVLAEADLVGTYERRA